MKTRPRKLLTLLSAAALFAFAQMAAPAARALDWSATEIEHTAEINKPLPPYKFTYTNSGTAPVTIAELHLSCGCLTPEMDNKTVAPGQSAQLIITFDRAGYVGEVTRTIDVVTDEPGNKTYHLTLNAHLPEAITFAPRYQYWSRGEAPATKSVDVTISLPRPVAITGATIDRGDITASLVTLEPGRHYRLDITPRDTSSPRMAIITLQPASPLPEGAVVTVYAQVR